MVDLHEEGLDEGVAGGNGLEALVLQSLEVPWQTGCEEGATQDLRCLLVSGEGETELASRPNEGDGHEAAAHCFEAMELGG